MEGTELCSACCTDIKFSVQYALHNNGIITYPNCGNKMHTCSICKHSTDGSYKRCNEINCFKYENTTNISTKN